MGFNVSTKYWSLVISSVCKVNEHTTITISTKELTDYLVAKDVLFFAMLEHNAEDSADFECEKYKHIHLILELDNASTGKSLANDLARRFGILFTSIQYRAIRSLKGICNYITHTGERWLNKEQFTEDDVITNDRLKFYRYRNGLGSLDLEMTDLISICDNEDDILQIYKAFGLKNVLRYRNVIQDVDYVIKHRKIKKGTKNGN